MTDSTPITTLDLIADRYVAAWNETDPTRRRARIEGLWVVDGVHATATLHARGYDEIERRIADAHRRFVVEGGCRFALHDSVDGHHHTMRLVWEMRPADGGDVAALGFDFLVLTDDGRIAADYQYPEPQP